MAKLFVRKKIGLVQENRVPTVLTGTLIFSFKDCNTSFASFCRVYTGTSFLDPNLTVHIDRFRKRNLVEIDYYENLLSRETCDDLKVFITKN